MQNLIGIVNYGIAGNTYSIQKAIEAAGGVAKIINTASDFHHVDKIVIPGVGSFNDAMKELEDDGYIELIQSVISDKPVLGICLGMQILAEVGFEYGRTNGMGVISAEVRPMQVNAKVPHMGFNSLNVVGKNPVLEGLELEEFYFMHSYEMVNFTDVSALTDYAGHTFVSAIHRKNVYGVQFHPEKSRDAGIQLFRNFLAL